MYKLCFQRAFTARHSLVGGDWGSENREHAHSYRIEWELRAHRLDRHDYLVDLLDVERDLESALARFGGACLNELPEFADANPSLERFAKVLWDRLSPSLPAGVDCAVRIWENESAWAAYEDSRPEPRAG